MPAKEVLDKLSIYIPQTKKDQKPIERLIKLGAKRDRSVNYLVMQAILEYVEREDRKKG
jgi:predicted transcriptional regulator